nr:uncharacterized protein LOC119167547 isoform X3 [Rhipicephalus microplus]
MESPIKSAQLRAAVVPSIFVNEQNASEAPKAHLLKRPKDQVSGRRLGQSHHFSRSLNTWAHRILTHAVPHPMLLCTLILGWLLLGGTTIVHTSKPNHHSEIDQDDVTEEVLKVAPGLACDLGQAVETSPEPACETNNSTEKSVQVQLLMHHEGSQTDEKKIVSSTSMQTEPYTCFSASNRCTSECQNAGSNVTSTN